MLSERGRGAVLVGAALEVLLKTALVLPPPEMNRSWRLTGLWALSGR